MANDENSNVQFDEINNQNLIDYYNFLENTILIYSTLIILIVGLILNSINIVICLRRRIQKETIGFYSPLMSTFNISSLIFGFIVLAPQNKPILILSSLNCKFIFYALHISIHLTSWIYVMCSFDRMICITYPRKHKIFKNKILLFFLFGLLFAIVSFLNIKDFFFNVEYVDSLNYTLTFSYQNKTCTSFLPNIILIRSVINQLLQIILPFILELILNI